MKKYTLKQLVYESKNDPNVIALILQGSRGKGFHKPSSDYDLLMIVKDSTKILCKKSYYKNLESMDLGIQTLSELKENTKLGRTDDWDRYDYAHVKYIVNKSKKIKDLIKNKAYLPKKAQRSWINSSLGAYTNSFFRSVKAKQKGYHLGSQLEAAGSIPPLLNGLFGLELRHSPFYGYLKNELDKYPLKSLPYSKQVFLQDIKKILDGDIQTQQKMFRKVKKLFIAKGYKQVFDEWEGKDDWAANLKLTT